LTAKLLIVSHFREEGGDVDSTAAKEKADKSRLEKKIDKLEDYNIGEKHWTLVGEVSSSKRPFNSLLEVPLEYDSTQKVRTPPLPFI
jgi:U3 small nucleolar ribonucleoprotein component